MQPVKLHFLSEYDIPHNRQFANTTVGGLSGIDYDSKSDLYYIISDDRSAMNPARFYTAKIPIHNRKIDSVQLVSVQWLLQPNGMLFPNTKQDPQHTIDPEAIRFISQDGNLVWSSEGERIIRNDTTVLQDPSINIMSVNGRYLDSFTIPKNMKVQVGQRGPRQNGVFEGMTFTAGGKDLLVSVEEPLYEDGPRAGTSDSSAWVRIIRFDVNSRKAVAQYGYHIDPVAFPAIPADAFKINGIPDILHMNDSTILVIERSFSTGRPGCTIKVFQADLGNADDISADSSLLLAHFREVRKKLLLNMDDLGIYIDNIEGVCWGPVLPNGNRTLVFVGDNNFSADEVTQFLLFEVENR